MKYQTFLCVCAPREGKGRGGRVGDGLREGNEMKAAWVWGDTRVESSWR